MGCLNLNYVPRLLGDARARLASITQRTGTGACTTTLDYDALGNLAAITGRARQWVLDHAADRGAAACILAGATKASDPH